MNLRAVQAIYRFEMARTGRTIWQSIVSPVLSTSLYFVVFGAAIGSRNELAARHGMSVGALDVELQRFRQRFGALLREQVVRTVSSPDEEVAAEGMPRS